MLELADGEHGEPPIRQDAGLNVSHFNVDVNERVGVGGQRLPDVIRIHPCRRLCVRETRRVAVVFDADDNRAAVASIGQAKRGLGNLPE